MLPNKPEYRARLFLAADLVGSTAFKSVKKNQEFEDDKARPKWVSKFDEFYRMFPRNVQRAYTDSHEIPSNSHEQLGHPKLWKTIGDEIILCCRVMSRGHASECVEAFLKCLEEYSDKLRGEGDNLDVKGNMWLATFPAPNTSIPLIRHIEPEPETTVSEEIETEIDEQPHQYDFLGKAIDTGFRVAKHSSAAKCTLTVQLAYLLACENLAPPETGRVIHFSGTEVFKGVNDGTPYPCLSISTETRNAHAELVVREQKVSGKSSYGQLEMKDYLEKFMEVAKIEYIWLPEKNGGSVENDDKPISYRNFETMFDKEVALIERQDKQMADAEQDGRDPKNSEEIPEKLSDDLIDDG